MIELTHHTADAPTSSAPARDEPALAELLQSVVDVARAIFAAQAGSIMLLDRATGELVFRAVSGQGQEFLVGRRVPAGQGIAGWVATSGEPMIVDDLRGNASFDRGFAESTHYVPDALMAAPLLHAGKVLGVLEVLDPAPQARASLPELDLLSLFARQAATALQLATTTAPPAGALSADKREAVSRLLAAAERLLDEP